MDIKLRSNNKKSDKNIYLIVLGIIITFYMGLGVSYKPIKKVVHKTMDSYNELYLKAVWGVGNKGKE